MIPQDILDYIADLIKNNFTAGIITYPDGSKAIWHFEIKDIK